MSTHTSNIDRERLQRLAELTRKLAVVHGKVTLSSGRGVGYYVGLRRATLHRESSRLAGSLLRELTADWDYAHVDGLTFGTDPVTTSVMRAEGRPIDVFMVHKETKKHGTQRHAEGPGIVSKEVLVVEGTTMTGNSPLTAVAALREAGAGIVGATIVVSRATGVDEAIEAEGLEYRYLLGLGGLGPV